VRYRRGAAIAALVFAFVHSAHAAFERAPLDPESAALGGILAASTDAVFGNPAAWLRSDAPRLAGWVARPFGLPELDEAQASAAWRAQRCGAGFGARRFGGAGYVEREARATLAWLATPDVAIGAAVRGLVVDVEDLDAVRSAAVDAAFRLRVDARTEIGVVAEALAGELAGDDSTRRRRTSLGAVHSGDRLSIYLEAQKRDEEELIGVVGISCRPWPALAVHGGLREIPSLFAWGITVRSRSVAVDLAVENVEGLGTTIRVGIAAGR